MRPNYAQDPPPTSIEIGGFAYPCAIDYRVWLGVLRLMREINPGAGTDDARRRTAEAFVEIQVALFGGVLYDEDPAEVLRAVAEFSRGYPMAPSNDVGGTDDAPLYSLEYDLNAIIIAIRNQSGIDLSYRRKEPFHWWEFLLELRTLSGDHYILNLMDARGYKGKDKELLRRKHACALPPEYTAEEQAVLDAFNAQFATGWENLPTHTDQEEDQA